MRPTSAPATGPPAPGPPESRAGATGDPLVRRTRSWMIDSRQTTGKPARSATARRRSRRPATPTPRSRLRARGNLSTADATRAAAPSLLRFLVTTRSSFSHADAPWSMPMRPPRPGPGALRGRLRGDARVRGADRWATREGGGARTSASGERGAGCGVRGARCEVRGAGCGVRGAGSGVRRERRERPAARGRLFGFVSVPRSPRLPLPASSPLCILEPHGMGRPALGRSA